MNEWTDELVNEWIIIWRNENYNRSIFKNIFTPKALKFYFEKKKRIKNKTKKKQKRQLEFHDKNADTKFIILSFMGKYRDKTRKLTRQDYCPVLADTRWQTCRDKVWNIGQQHTVTCM